MGRVILDSGSTQRPGRSAGVLVHSPSQGRQSLQHALIGRERECDALQRMLLRADAVLVTVTGPGGMGKTRLATAIADACRARFDHGVGVVALEAVRDVEFVPAAIGQALGLQGQGSQPEWQRIKDYLRERRSLLVLDNFEHLLGAAPLVGELLRDAPQLKILVTSRVRLHLSAEQEFPLGPLELPRLPLQGLCLDEVASVQLFAQRAQALQPQFVIDNNNAEAVAAVCVRLDGWPLAIELAAARIKLMTPQQMLQRLQKRLGLLVGGPVDQPLRQRTLRSTLDWSHDLLGPIEQELFARVSVFNGGAELEAIEAVCAGAVPDVMEMLHSLVNHSLLQQEGGRFALLETIREYAAEQLQAAGREHECRLAHAKYYLALAEQAEAEQSGPNQHAWFERLEPELDNFREAMSWALRNEHAPMALRMACGLSLLCMLRGLGKEARSWIESGLSATSDTDDPLRANALAWLGMLCGRLGDLVTSQRHLEEALRRYRQLSDAAGIARSLTDLAWAIVWQDGNHSHAVEALEEALAIAQALGDRAVEGRAAAALGTILSDRGDLAAARELLQRGLALSREAQDQWRVTVALANLGNVYGRQGMLAQARHHAEQALARSRAEGNVYGEVACLINLAEWTRGDGEPAPASAMLREALSKSFAVGDWRSAAIALDNLAEMFLDASNALTATKLLASAAARRQRYGIGAPSGSAGLVESLQARASAMLGEAAFNAAMREGGLMSMSDITALVGSTDIHIKSMPCADDAAPASLTPRELEVLRLVVGGLSDKQLAARLGISPTTASKHVANLLGKTMTRNRLALTLWAIEQGLPARDT